MSSNFLRAVLLSCLFVTVTVHASDGLIKPGQFAVALSDGVDAQNYALDPLDFDDDDDIGLVYSLADPGALTRGISPLLPPSDRSASSATLTDVPIRAPPRVFS